MRTTLDPAHDDPRVLQAAQDYLAELEAGRRPERGIYLAREPDLADVLQACFDDVDTAHLASRLLGDLAPQPEHLLDALGDYLIEREIGRGGMGVVYEALQISLNRRIALKVLPFAAGLDGKQLRRFKTEAHAAAQLHHSNIVPVYAVGCERGVHFYAMQLIEGRSLDAVIRELRGEANQAADGATTIDLRAAAITTRTTSARIPARTGRTRDGHLAAARIAAQVGDALEYAHDAGIVHRDIKPANLLLDAKGNVWVTDFGLAQITADVGLTQTGEVFGTLRYMSPEQASGQRVLVDQRTDVYSLGATLYEMLTLEPIFAERDRRALLNQILNEEPRSPRAVNRSVPVELETIVLKAVAKVPAERYATAGELAADLRRFLEQRPILARRPSIADRARKWVRRHPSSAGAAVVVLALAAAGLGISTAVIAHEQAKTKEALEREAQSVAVIAEEQTRTRSALDSERLRAEEAQERFQMARRAADEMIRMAEEELLDKPHLLGLRKRLLELALVYYQQFIELRRDDPNTRADLSLTRDRVRQIIDDLAAMQGAGHFFLLREAAVLDDLGASAEQRQKLAAFGRWQSERSYEAFRSFHRLSEEAKRQRFLDQARSDEADVTSILGAAKVKRLQQIVLQRQGLVAFRDLDVIATLKLSVEQRDQIRVIEGDLQRKQDIARAATRKEQDRKEQERLLAVALEKVDAVLKPDQALKWKEMTGVPFKGVIPARPMKGLGGPEPKGQK